MTGNADYGSAIWHLLLRSPSWGTKQHCICGAEFASRCEFWKHQADAYQALALGDGSTP